ncbi:MAG: hypothetical protein J2O38_01145, partial [Acidimicrobiales bacterium]|nr:hypothetical protein [Acidimicrobiales bacterium]
MTTLLPLAVVVPLIMAALLSAANLVLRPRRRILDALAIATALSVTGMLVYIVLGTRAGDVVYWFGGFRPARGVTIGIDFAVGPLNGALAALAALLVAGAMVFSWRYFEQVSTY